MKYVYDCSFCAFVEHIEERYSGDPIACTQPYIFCPNCGDKVCQDEFEDFMVYEDDLDILSVKCPLCNELL